MIFRLDQRIAFPDPALAEEDGLLAVGGDLSAERLLLAYRHGIFPWFSEGEPICWFSPKKRCVIFPNSLHVSKTMKKVLARGNFSVTVDTAFEAVIATCKTIYRKGQEGTWITDEMEAAYIQLYKQGHAHSTEVWSDGVLAGGIYGVTVNGIFCGESMFSRKTNASKLALISLCRSGNYSLIDAQMPNAHLMSLGAEMISGAAFRHLLQE